MISRNIHAVFSLCGVAAFLGTGCGVVLGLDDYTENPTGPGGAAGMGNGGNGGQAGQGGQGGQGGGPGECMPNETAACYSGPAGTQDKGVCKAGTKTCGADSKYGPCMGEVLPSLENCAAALTDEDCNGSVADCTGSPVWSVGYGSDANSQGGFKATGMTDSSVVVTGIFTDTFAFGACGMISTSATFPDIFLAKLGADGTCQFVKKFGDNGGYDYGYDVAITKNDDIVLTGGFTSAGIDFGGGVLGTQGSNDMYVAKFNKMGAHQWSKRYGDDNDQLANTVSLDGNDNIFVAGDFGGTLDFGSGIGVTEASFGQAAGFITKLDAAGAALYSRSFAVANAGAYLMGTHAAVDAQGNATVVGRFKGSLNVGGTMLVSVGTAADAFAIRYAPDGTLVYAKSFGAPEEDLSFYVATAPDGSVYISGTTMGTSLNLNSFLAGKTLTGAGGGDVFLIKLNPDGTFSDAKVFGNAMDQSATSVAVDPLGHVILGGSFAGQIDFGKGALNAGQKTLFLAKFDGALKPLWSKAFFSDKPESTVRVGTDPFANILITGGYSGVLQIEIGKALAQQGNGDIFIAKLAP